MSLISVTTTADMPAGENWQEQLGHTNTKNSWDVNRTRFHGICQLAHALIIYLKTRKIFLRTPRNQRMNKGYRLSCNCSFNHILLELQLLTSTEREIASKLTFSSKMLPIDASNNWGQFSAINISDRKGHTFIQFTYNTNAPPKRRKQKSNGWRILFNDASLAMSAVSFASTRKRREQKAFKGRRIPFSWTSTFHFRFCVVI